MRKGNARTERKNRDLFERLILIAGLQSGLVIRH